MDSETFFQTGGTLPADAPSYVPRSADAELLAALQRGELCYVLNARQMGKSSLCVRTRRALEAEGIRTAFLDLQKFGSSVTAEQWYRSLLERLGYDLKLRNPFLAYWRDNAERTPLDRLFGALRDVALDQLSEPIVIFLDEIDVVLDLSFKTDEFFAAIRACLNARADDPIYQRLTFCIIGTVAPTALIRDIRLSPFNVGTRVRLVDFTPAEAAPLAGPLPGGANTLARVLHWTGGHPYLTQRLCSELTKASSSDIDAMVTSLFFAKSDAEVDDNIKNVRNGVLRLGGGGSGFDRTDVLLRYDRIVAGKRVADDDTDGVCTALRLSGLVASTDGLLVPRCRIYTRIFDRAWVRANLPDAEVRRQRAAVAKTRWQIGSVAASILLAMGALTTWALTSRQTARSAEMRARRETEKAVTNLDISDRLAYAANANLTQTAVESNHYDLAAQYLKDMGQILERNRHIPAGYEWCYLTEQVYPEAQRFEGHEETVVSATLSADGRRLLTASEDGTARVWDVATGQERLRLTLPGEDLYAAAFSVHGDRIVTASREEPSRTSNPDTVVRLWDSARGKERLRVTGDEASLLPNRDRFLLARNGSLESWDIPTGHRVSSRKRPSPTACSPDGRYGAWSDWSDHVGVFNLDTGREILLQGHPGSVNAAAFSPDSRHLVTASLDRTARTWDVATGRLVWESSKHGARIDAVAFSPDGEYVATAGEDRVVCLWNARTGRALQQRKGHGGSIRSVVFTPDSRCILTASDDQTVRLWNIDVDQEALRFAGHAGSVATAAFSPDGQYVVTTGDDKTARVWDAVSGRERLRVSGSPDYINHVQFAPDNARLLTGRSDGAVQLWDISAKRERTRMRGHDAVVTSLAFFADGRRIVTASADQTVRVWDATTGKESARMVGENSGTLYFAALSPDETRILTGSRDEMARVWDVRTGKRSLLLKGHLGQVSAGAFSPDGTRILTASNDDFEPRVWDGVTGALLFSLSGHEDGVNAAVFSADGRRILTASDDGTARVWDAATGVLRLVLRGHTDRVNSAVFSPDGERILTASDDGTARVWDARIGRTLLTLKGHTREVNTAAFSPDEQRILTASKDGTARVWRKLTEAQVQRIRSERTLQDSPLRPDVSIRPK